MLHFVHVKMDDSSLRHCEVLASSRTSACSRRFHTSLASSWMDEIQVEAVMDASNRFGTRQASTEMSRLRGVRERSQKHVCDGLQAMHVSSRSSDCMLLARL